MSEVKFLSLMPYLRYPDGDEAVDWLSRVLGFGPARKVAGDDGAWEEGEIDAGQLRISICGKHDPAPERGIGSLLIVTVDDVDAMYDRSVDPWQDHDLIRDPRFAAQRRELARLARQAVQCAGRTCPRTFYRGASPR